MAQLYYIQNRSKGFLGNSIIWWGKNSRGYTADLNEAGKYTEEEAKKICTGHLVENVAYPCEYIDSNEGVQRHVDMQYIDINQIAKF
jgi:hypothetical protein